MQRRDFLKAGGAACAGLAAGARRCHPLPTRSPARSPGRACGLAMRCATDAWSGQNRVLEKVSVLIVGGGVAGLSAAYYLSKAGLHDHLLLEMEDEIGGNAAWGENRVTRYPWGAHYLPLPSRESMHVRHMLHEFGMLLDGVDAEAPTYDERLMVHAPAERVFDGSLWREGVFQEDGLAQGEKDERRRFGEAMERFQKRLRRGRTESVCHAGRIVVVGSAVSETRQLDHGGMVGRERIQGCETALVRELLLPRRFRYRHRHGVRVDGRALLCRPRRQRDSRRARGVPDLARGAGASDDGAGAPFRGRRERGFVYRLTGAPEGIRALAYFPESGEQRRDIGAESHLGGARPRGQDTPSATELVADRRALEVESAPWVVANLELRDWPMYRPEAPFSWDNVIMGGRGLGYVVATHQDIVQATHGPTVLTCYDAWSQGGDFARNRGVLERADLGHARGKVPRGSAPGASGYRLARGEDGHPDMGTCDGFARQGIPLASGTRPGQARRQAAVRAHRCGGLFGVRGSELAGHEGGAKGDGRRLADVDAIERI